MLPMAKKTKGSEFEELVHQFFENVFTELGYTVIEVRKQWAGTQNGFDVKVVFLDSENNERSIFFECKDYECTLSWNDILPKIIELESSNYAADGFIAISPKVEISNIDDNILPVIKDKFKFPIRFWTPDTKIKDVFCLNDIVYEKIYNEQCPEIDRAMYLNKLKNLIELIIAEKKLLSYTNKIEIAITRNTPNEDSNYVTNLDNKLNEVLSIDDEDRTAYHQYRCDYKIYLEGLTDVNNSLRLKIIKWQDNLRIKAKRLTKKFNTVEDYTPKRFFHDFFEEAERDLIRFYDAEKLFGDGEKLLNGVVFELAAECPLDWRKQ